MTDKKLGDTKVVIICTACGDSPKTECELCGGTGKLTVTPIDVQMSFGIDRGLNIKTLIESLNQIDHLLIEYRHHYFFKNEEGKNETIEKIKLSMSAVWHQIHKMETNHD